MHRLVFFVRVADIIAFGCLGVNEKGEKRERGAVEDLRQLPLEFHLGEEK